MGVYYLTNIHVWGSKTCKTYDGKSHIYSLSNLDRTRFSCNLVHIFLTKGNRIKTKPTIVLDIQKRSLTFKT